MSKIWKPTQSTVKGPPAPPVAHRTVGAAKHVQAAIQACLQPRMPAGPAPHPVAPHVRQAVAQVQAKPAPAAAPRSAGVAPRPFAGRSTPPVRVIQRMMEDTGGGSSIQRVDVMDTSEDALPDGWPASVVVNGKTWNGFRKFGYIVYESPDEVRTTKKFGKIRLRNHVRIDTSQPLQKWDGVYHVTFYAVADGTNCEGVESGNSICLHTYYRCGMILSYDDGDIEGLNRGRFHSQINGISRDFWHSIERNIKKAVGLGSNEYQILSPQIAYQEHLLGSGTVYYEVGPGVVRKIAESSGYWKVELKGCTLRSIVHGSRPEQKFVQSGFAVWMDASLLR